MRRRERRAIQDVGHNINIRQLRCKYNVKAVELGVPVVTLHVEPGLDCERGKRRELTIGIAQKYGLGTIAGAVGVCC